MRNTLSRIWWGLIVALVLLPYACLLAPPARAITSSVPASWAALGARWSGLSSLTGSGSATDDDLLIYDTSATALKRISRSELLGLATSTHYACQLVNSADQTITASTLTTITWNTEVTDANGMHDTVSNTGRVVAQVTGTMFIHVRSYPNYTSGSLSFYKNGSHYASFSLNPTAGYNDAIAAVPVTAGDYVEHKCYQTAGAGPYYMAPVTVNSLSAYYAQLTAINF